MRKIICPDCLSLVSQKTETPAIMNVVRGRNFTANVADSLLISVPLYSNGAKSRSCCLVLQHLPKEESQLPKTQILEQCLFFGLILKWHTDKKNKKRTKRKEENLKVEIEVSNNCLL